MAAQTVEVSGLRLAAHRRGEGAPALFVHGAGVGAELWQETLAALGSGLEAITYDRRAYGDSEAPEPYGGTTVEEQSEDAARLIEALGLAPVTVCGHELGALIALDLVRRHPGLVRGAVAIEPPALWLSRRGPEVLSAMREAVTARVRADGPVGAVDAYFAEMDGPGAFDRLGAQRLEHARGSARALAVDLGAATSWSVQRGDLRALAAPVIVMRGARSGAIRREVAGTLAELIPGARVEDAEAGHFVPLQDPDAVAAAVRGLAAA